MENIKYDSSGVKYLLLIASFVIVSSICGMLVGYFDMNIEVLLILILIPVVLLSVKYVWLAVAAFLFLIPLNILFILSSGQTLNKLVAIFLIALAVLSGRIRYISEAFKNTKSILIILYGLVGMLSLFYAENIDNSLYNLGRLWFLIGFYFLLIVVFREEDKLDIVLWALVLGAVISVLSPFLFSIGRIEGTELTRYGGLWGDQNEFATILLGVLPVSLALFFCSGNKLLKIAAAACFLTLLTGFILTFSRGGFVAFGLTVCIAIAGYMIKGQNRINVFLIASITFIISIIFAYFVFHTEIMGRMETLNVMDRIQSVSAERSLRIRYINYVKVAPRLFLENPILGVGFKDFEYYSPYKMNSHNTYIEVLTGLGLLGFIPFILIIYLSLKEFGRYHKYINSKSDRKVPFSVASGLQYGFIAYLIAAIFITADTNKMFWIFIALSAMLANQIRINSRRMKQSGQNVEMNRRRYVPPKQSRRADT